MSVQNFLNIELTANHDKKGDCRSEAINNDTNGGDDSTDPPKTGAHHFFNGRGNGMCGCLSIRGIRQDIQCHNDEKEKDRLNDESHTKSSGIVKSLGKIQETWNEIK